MAPGLDWEKHLKGKCLLPERVNALLDAVRPIYNSARSMRRLDSRWDYRRLSRALGLPALTAYMAERDPAKPSTEDKLQAVRNLITTFEELPPALAHAGFHSAVLSLYQEAREGWEVRKEALATLRALLEGCAVTPVGIEPFEEEEQEGLAEVVDEMALFLVKVAEEGMKPEHGEAVDNCLESLFSVLRYRESDLIQEIKEGLWEDDVPAFLLQLAREPASAYGHEEGVERDEGLESYIKCMSNLGRVLSGMCLVGNDPMETMQQNGELLSYKGVWASLLAFMEVAADLLYSPRYWAMSGQEGSQSAGGALMRNTLACAGYGAMFAPPGSIDELKEAGWEPLLQRMRDDTTYRGPYREFFHLMPKALLKWLPKWKGTEAQARRLGQELFELTAQYSIPREVRGFQGAREPRQPSQAEMEARRVVAQSTGPDGAPMNLYQLTLIGKDYTQHCAGCGKEEGELPQGCKLKVCVQCRRARYCSKECQKAAWKGHKEECNRYKLEQQGEDDSD